MESAVRRLQPLLREDVAAHTARIGVRAPGFDQDLPNGPAVALQAAVPRRTLVLACAMTSTGTSASSNPASRVDLTPGNDDAEFGPTSQAAARELQRRYGLVVWNNGMVADGIVGQQTWTATVAYPPLPARIDHRAFVTDVREDYDEVTGVLIGDATGNNRVFLQLHNRASRP